MVLVEMISMRGNWGLCTWLPEWNRQDLEWILKMDLENGVGGGELVGKRVKGGWKVSVGRRMVKILSRTIHDGCMTWNQSFLVLIRMNPATISTPLC